MTIDPEGNRFYGEDAEVDTSQNNKKARENNVVNWEGSKNNPAAFAGTVSRAKSITRTGANSQTYTYAGRTYDYRQEWPNGAYPKYPKKMFAYPNVPYDEANNNALTGGTTAGGDPKDHEHIYLEREDFTAIRQLEPIRPLVNPVANEWDWTLYQKWAAVYQIHATYYSWEPVEWDNHGNVIRWDWVKTTEGYINPESYPFDGTDKMPIKNMGDMVGTKYFGQGCNDTSKRCVHEGYTPVLNYAEWIFPANKGGGQRGEFRGPAYVGYHEDDSTIRYADNRIWQAGAPGHKQEYERKYGANLIWWSTQDSAFENHATSNGWDPRARRVDINTTKDKDGNPNGGEGSEDLVWAKQPDTLQADGNDARDRDIEIQPTGDITNGLIRIGGTDRTGGKLPTLGQEQKWAGNHWEDHHKTSTRIFGHYHLAYADQDERKVQDMGMNSYLGARSFVAKVKDKLDTPTAQGYWANLDSQPVEYSIGAEPITLKKVQYGRVTSQLDLSSGEGPFGDGFLRAPFAKKGTQDSVDNYFFRGIDATSVADMPKEGSATYKGHALMYGINNDFHGITGDVSVKGGTRSLPNAFAGVQQRGNAEIGLGNFVEANVDFATRKVKGDVYNAWLVDVKKANVVHDKLVAFEGDITGNTVLGKADRTYIPGNDEADFRAAFFGKEADEMGGSFNSVKPDDKYGSAYEYGDWGGAFGAKKIGTNTFQGDDGANLYGNSNTQQNNYGP